MQTRFSAARLADPDIAEANGILRACVHCGFCTATCPTYVLLGDELDGPRGRIYLIKEMLEQDRPPSATDMLHIDRCLSCLACMTTCPSGVHYMHLVDHARAHIERTHRRPWTDRVVRDLLGRVLPDPVRVARALSLARLARPVARHLPGILGRLLALAPPDRKNKVVTPYATPAIFPAEGERKHRVALLAGCVQQAAAPRINQATVRLLTRHGCEVVVAAGAGCCGALTHHLGQEDRARAAAAANIRAWRREIEDAGLDAIVVNASGCGTMVKDYGFLFRDDPALAGDAAAVSALARDISEFIERIGLRPATAPASLRVAYQSACSLQHGQRIHRQPVALLKGCGFEVVEPTNGHLCCGSAGTYNILQGDIAGRLRERKLASLAALTPQAIASGNVGCMVQLAAGAPCPVVHTAELLDWATGGPRPEPLRGVE